jgi:hypothetical protein
MKWFLQFLSLGSAVLYMLLVFIDHRIRDGTAENTSATDGELLKLGLRSRSP